MKKLLFIFAVAVLAARVSFAVVGQPVEQQLFESKFEAEKAAFEEEKTPRPRLFERILTKKMARKAARNIQPNERDQTKLADNTAKAALILGIVGWALMLFFYFNTLTVDNIEISYQVLFSFVFGILALIAAIITGSLALEKGTTQRKWAKTGLFLGIVFLGISIIALFLLFFATYAG